MSVLRLRQKIENLTLTIVGQGPKRKNLLKIIVIITKQKKIIIGIKISGEEIISVILGTSEFCSIIFSNPLPIETAKKI